MNLYLKHRPQTFKEVIGQNHVTGIIENAIKNGNNPHAYLLVGTRGTGKTTIGRVITKSLNCDNFGCGTCSICLNVQNGVFPDLIEIDAASNRGIDNIRSLKEQVNYSPQHKTKVYIIDECHMLTKEASNALLKVLEEPPAGVVFVLCTTEEDKILPTIKSRCQIHSLSLVSESDLVLNLQVISEKEGIQLKEGILEFIAQQAKGSVRDSISLLDKFRDSELNLLQLKDQLGVATNGTVIRFVKSLANKNPSDAFTIINEIAKSGGNLESFYLDTIEFLQNINYKIAGFDNTSYMLYPQVEQLYTSFSGQFLIECFDSLTHWKTRVTPFGKLNLEVAVAKICLFENTPVKQVETASLPMDWMTPHKKEEKEDEDDF